MKASDNESTPRHPVRVAALRTGLTPHTLRAWERRYNLIAPTRSDGGQRLYSDLDLQRLRLLRRLTDRGHSIARLAGASVEELQRTAEHDLPDLREARWPVGESGVEEFRSAALEAVRKLDGGELQAVLERAAVKLGVPTFLDLVAGPSLQMIGQGWSDGTVSIGQEHLASSVFQRVLGWILRVYEAKEGGPRLVVATPPRQVHELGAMLAADAAAAEGWNVFYLGADLPVADILASARQVGANGVALSIVHPSIDPALLSDLERLRGGLDSQTALLLGGAAASAAGDRLKAMGTEVIDSLADFRSSLRRLQERQ
jgi:DNA-binding transcriptional MerR regulator/methylmalonyl-CoA mutase cobalamin-binding subunit